MMENGVKTSEVERATEGMKVVGGDGALQAVSVGGEAGGSRQDVEENEIFEEAMDTPREYFLTPHHRDSHDFVFKRVDENQEPSSVGEVKEFGDSVDAQLNDGTFEEAGTIGSADCDDPADASVSNRDNEEQEVVVSENKVLELPDVQVNGQITGSHEAVDPAGTIGFADCDDPADASVSNRDNEEQEVVVLENKVVELPDVQVNGQITGSHEAVDPTGAIGFADCDDPADASVSNRDNEEQEVVVSENKVVELPDVQVNGQIIGSHAAVEAGMSDEPLDAQVDARSLDERATVGSEEKMEARDESDHQFEVAAESVVDGVSGEVAGDVEGDPSLLSEYREKKLVQEKYENGEINGANSDGSRFVVPEMIVNGESHHTYSADPMRRKYGVPQMQDGSVTLNGPSNKQAGEPQYEDIHRLEDCTETDNGIDAETGAPVVPQKQDVSVTLDGPSNKQTGELQTEDGVPQKRDISVTLNGPSNRQTEELQTEEIHPLEGLTEPDNEVEAETETGTSVAKEGGIREPLVQFRRQTPSSDLVEDLGESSSSDDHNSNTPSQPAPSANSYPANSGSPTLPSLPTSFGSSVPAGAPSLPSLLTSFGSSAPTGTPSLPSRPDSLGSAAPTGAPSLPPRPVSQGSPAPTGDSSLPSRPASQVSSDPTEAPSLSSRPASLRSAPTGSPSLPSRPAGLGSSAPLLEPASRSLQQSRANGSVPQRQSQPSEEIANDDAGDRDEKREKLQMIRVKFLRLALRLGQTPHNVVVAQVLYRLGLAEQLSRNTNRPGVFSFDQASIMAEQLETAGQDPLDFSCTIMVIGKTGVGKSSTINSIFDEVLFRTDAFQPSTKRVQEIVGTVQGINVRVIDTPGLLSSSSDQRGNERILRSVKRFISKTSPDIVLYFDRLDMQSRDFGDVPLLRTITDVFGASIWFNAIVVLTHAASAPPDGPNGTPLSYEMFVTQRSHVVQQAIRQAAGDVRLMNPVSLVENHSACRINRAGQRVLPNGQVWKPQLLLLSFASKILAEANMLLQLQDSPPGQPFGSRARVPPLPYLLTSLLQSRPRLKSPEEQFGDEDTMDEDLDEASDSDGGSDYDELPPFKCLTKAQLEKLNKAQKKAYFEELDYREKLFFRKQLKEEKKRRKLMKKMAEAATSTPSDYSNENLEDESSGPASMPTPMPDCVLPASFDSDNPSHRYRFVDSSSPWLVRPGGLDSQGWDHDVGYEGLNVERLFLVKDKIPLSVSGQLTKDKKEFNLQMEAGSSIKHSEGKATSLFLDMQTVGKDIAYTLRGETMFNNFRQNNTTAGISVTVLGDSVSAGVKIEDKLIISKSFRLLMSGGVMNGRGDVAYGGRLEATLRDKDYPLGRMLSTLALSVVDWHGDLALGCNVQSQIPLGRGTNLIGHANLSNRGSGQVGIRLNSSEYLQIALLALVPIFRNVKRVLSGSSQSM